MPVRVEEVEDGARVVVVERVVVVVLLVEVVVRVEDEGGKPQIRSEVRVGATSSRVFGKVQVLSLLH